MSEFIGKSNYSFCTFFDVGYLARGLTLIKSLRGVGETNQIMIVCLDKISRDLLEPLSDELNLKLIDLDTLILTYPDLEDVRNNRKRVEFYFTCTPFILKYGLADIPANHLLIYLDADLFFFDQIDSILTELGDASVGIIKHNYPRQLNYLARKYGTFNVGLIAIKNDQDGNSTLNWWAERCLEWCFDYPEDGNYADQGYLDRFPEISSNLKILGNPGFNLAPWNSRTYSLRLDDVNVKVGNQNLVFFHFHNLKLKGDRWFSSQLNYFSPMRKRVFNAIYLPYLKELKKNHNWVMEHIDATPQIPRKGYGLRGVVANFARLFFMGLNLLFGQTISQRRIDLQ